MSSGLPKGLESFYTPEDNNLLGLNVHFGQGTEAGWENPRSTYEASDHMMTLDSGQRQLPDEDKSCGNQPAYIRVIYRRVLLLCPDLNGYF